MEIKRGYPQPLWRITLAGEDITQRIQPRLMQLTLTDNRGMEADQLDLTLDDSDGRLDIPTRGASIHLSLGWSDTGLIDKGSYTVDEVEHSGTPDQLTIRARSADLREGITTKKERSWHKTTVGAIVKKIADENGYTPAVSPELEKEPVAHLDQTSESDANLLTRLAELFDAVATVKAGRLLFFKIGRATTLSGLPIDPVQVGRRDGDRHRFSVADRDACDAVKACYYDTKSGKKGEVVITLKEWRESQLNQKKKGSKQKPEEKKKITHSGENVKTLRHTYATRASALRGAKSALEKARRGAATFSLSLAKGRPEVFPEQPATVAGWKPSIDGTDWLIAKVTHRLNPSGLVTDLELELALDGDENEQIDEA